jgi:glycerol kinase
LGAAYLAGLCVGVWSGVEEIAAQWQIDTVFDPALSRDDAAQRMHAWRQAVQKVMSP